MTNRSLKVLVNINQKILGKILFLPTPIIIRLNFFVVYALQCGCWMLVIERLIAIERDGWMQIWHILFNFSFIPVNHNVWRYLSYLSIFSPWDDLKANVVFLTNICIPFRRPLLNSNHHNLPLQLRDGSMHFRYYYLCK